MAIVELKRPRMRLAIEKWDRIIFSMLQLVEETEAITQGYIDNFTSQSCTGRESVRAQLMHGMLEAQAVRDKRQFIKLHQVMLIKMLDKIYTAGQNKQAPKNILPLYKTVSLHLAAMLKFLEDFFGNYFDRGEQVPASLLAGSLGELSRRIKLLEKSILPCPPYIHALGNILAGNFKKFCREKKGGATYDELSYQQDLMTQLLSQDTLTSENSIKEILFYYNYNDQNYIAYLFEKLALLTEPLENNNEKLPALRLEQKKINQLPVRLNCLLSGAMPSLKQMVNGWIEEEIKFLEADHLPPAANPGLPPARYEATYVHVPFKGAEIYLLHKSFLDSGGASGETYKSLFEKTASHLTNKNQKGFSTESLQKCSDKVDYESRENVKRFLQKMIRNIDSY